MACINKGKPLSPRIKFKTIQKIKEQEYISDQAYLIPENGGTAIYLSYDLNKALENVFNVYSINGYMGVTEFNKMCMDYNILPKNTDKDLICYIFQHAGSNNNGLIDFKGFFQLLHRLSSYAFRKLIMTEQEKFNVLIKHLKVSRKEIHDENPQKFNVGIQVAVEQKSIGTYTSVEQVNVCCNASISTFDKECVTDPVSFLENNTIALNTPPIEEKDVDEKTKVKEKVKEKKTEEYLNIPKPTVLSEDTKESEIKTKIKTENKEILKEAEHKALNKKQTEKINNALKVIDDKNKEIETLHKEYLKLVEAKEKKIEELNKEIEELKIMKNELKHSLELKQQETEEKKKQSEDLEDNFLRLKKILTLSRKEEEKLFKIFLNYSTYKEENGEYIMDQKQCAKFLATCYLLRKMEKKKKKINLTVTDAASLYQEAILEMNLFKGKTTEQSTLNYFCFKYFLSKIGSFLYPELQNRKSFIEIVTRHVLVAYENEQFLITQKKNGMEKKPEVKTSENHQSKKQSIVQDFDALKAEINGGYSSSSNNDVLTLEKSNMQKKKKKPFAFSNKKNNYKYSTDSFEYIDSNEVNKLRHMKELSKKKDEICRRKDKAKSEETRRVTSELCRIKKIRNPDTIKRHKNKQINDFINKNINYSEQYGYDMSSEDNTSVISLPSDNLNITLQKKGILKKCKTDKNKRFSNAKYLDKTKLIHFAKDPIYYSDLAKPPIYRDDKKHIIGDDMPLFEIEGTIWSPKAAKKEYFLANFGNE